MPDFPYTKASLTLAYAEVFGKQAALLFYQVPRGTYDRWKTRSNSDQKLKELIDFERERLINNWQADAILALKTGLGVSMKALENNPFHLEINNRFDAVAWSKAVEAMSKLLKSIGDITISTKVLEEEDEEEDED